MIYGYARCSTNETKQNIDRQIRELKDAGANDVLFEYAHGDATIKPQLELLLDAVQEGDTILVLEVSRLARSVKQLLQIVDQVKEKKICLRILNSITIDCRNGSIDPSSEAFLTISSVFSQLELSIIRERVKSGMQNAKAKGKRLGRRPITANDICPLFYKHYPSYVNGTMNVSELARVCNLSRNTVYKYLSLIEQNG